MQELVTGLIGAGGEAVVIDDGRSFQHTAEALGGAFIAFGKDPACLNPFAMIDAETANHDGDYREECFAMLAGVIGRMARRRGSIDDIEAALIAEAIAAAWDEAGNEADLGTVRKNLEARSDRRAADMATSLGPWCPGGAMGRLFAGSNVPDLENALTVFELAELKGRGDVQAVVLMLVVFLATQRMYHGPRTRAKAIVIDEAWDLLSGEDSKAFLEGAARRARKYRGALITGTQSVNDYYANPAAARGLGELGLGDLPRPEGRIRRAPEIREAHPLRPRHGARAEEPDDRRREIRRAGAARPGRLAGRPPRARRLVRGAVLVARPGLRGGRDAQGRRDFHRRGDRPACRGLCRCRPFGNDRNGRKHMTRNATAGGQRPLNWPDDPGNVTAQDIDFEALAHVLANTCRRGGCCRQYHSIAAHALIVSEEIEALDGLGDGDRRRLALHALLGGAASAWFRGEWAGSARAAEKTARLAAKIETRRAPGGGARRRARRGTGRAPAFR